MNKEYLEALKNIKIRCHSKSMKYDAIDFDLDTIEQALIEAEQNKKVIDELKTLVKYADFGKQEIISLAVLKNALKEVL